MTDRTNSPTSAPATAQSTHRFHCETLITYTQNNRAGVEEKKKEKVTFRLDDNGARMPWYVLRNYLVPRYLTAKYGPKDVGWMRIYEIKIIKQTNCDEPEDITGIPIRIMTYDQLGLYCKRWDLNVPVKEFYSVEKAREMVSLRLEDEKAYRVQLEDYREGKKRMFPELDRIRGAQEVLEYVVNDGGQGDPDLPYNVKVVPADGKPEKKVRGATASASAASKGRAADAGRVVGGDAGDVFSAV